MNMNMNEIEDKLASLFPMMKKNVNMSVKNIMGTPRANIKKMGKSNSNYKKMGNSNQ